MDVNFDQMKDEVTNPQDVSDMFTPEDMAANKVYGVLASFPILFWIPLVAAKDSGYGKFCANQGLILLIAGIILGVASAIVGMILGIIPILGGILAGIISLCVSLVTFAGFLFLFVSALQSKARYLPIVGRIVTFIK